MANSDQESTVVEGPRRAGPISGNRLPSGTPVDRYIIVDAIGRGGMGVVYSAYDPELDRRIALKLLRMDRLPPGGVVDGHQRLLREARSLAKLSHPNVVALYGAGTYGEHVYLAMEMVNGETLSGWLEQQRTTAAIIGVFVQAGRGLLAAHEAGLIHRDFKPSNVIVSADDRVKVLDFGLARMATSELTREDDLQDGSRDDASGPALEVPKDPDPDDGLDLTKTGALLGTPVYMAPEAMSGRFDQRSDQFSFCVALHEALFGVRPFRGADKEALLAAIATGSIDTTENKHVPARIRRIVRRGLEHDPGRRWPTMKHLLRELERDPKTIRRRALAASAVFGLGVVTTLGLTALDSEAQYCEAAPQRLASVWNADRKAAINGRFSSLNTPYATDTAARVGKRLDQYGTEWTDAHRRACEATHVQKTQPPEVLDLRMGCLDDRLRAFGALTEVLARANDDVLDHAVSAVESLAPVSTCGDLRILHSRLAPPDDRQRAAIEILRERLARIEATVLAAQYDQANERAQLLVKEAEASGYGPLLAEAQYVVGDLHARRGAFDDATKMLAAAALTAEAHRHDELVAKAQIRLVHVTGYDQSKFEEALQWERHARAALERLGGHDDLEAELDNSIGTMLARRDDWSRAERHFLAALMARERVHGPDHLSLAKILGNLGVATGNQGRIDEAIEYGERALKLRERALGLEHPDVAIALNNLASSERRAGRLEDAQTHLSRAIDLLESRLGPKHPSVGSAYSNLGNVMLRLGDVETALAYHRRALDIRLATLAPDHLSVAGGYAHVGAILVDLGRLDEAEPLLAKALEIAKGQLGEGHPSYGEVLGMAAKLYAARGDHDRAIEMNRRALEIMDAKLEPNHTSFGPVLIQLGEALIATHAPQEAIPHLERAVGNSGLDAEVLAAANLALSRALVAARGDRERAELAVRTSIALYGQRGVGFADRRDAANKWAQATFDGFRVRD